VPASKATLGLVDRLFSRVGASDNLARGRSTFMVEMVETAAILAQATPAQLRHPRRGRPRHSTYDGLAIAWAVVEAIHDRSRCRCLFATHYHELTRLAERLDALSLHHVRAREWKGELVFLHELAPGPADRSYGLAVAKLAGLPPPVLARAKSVLAKLEEGRAATGGIARGWTTCRCSPRRREEPKPDPLAAAWRGGRRCAEPARGAGPGVSAEEAGDRTLMARPSHWIGCAPRWRRAGTRAPPIRARSGRAIRRSANAIPPRASSSISSRVRDRLR
jgi:DNA mismatch repair protein MutS